MMQEALALDLDLEAPELATKYGLRMLGDPVPMPRVKASVQKGRDGKPFVKMYTPTWATDAQDAIAAGWAGQGYPTFPAGTPVEARLTFGFARPSGHLDAKGSVKARYLEVHPGQGTARNADDQRTGGDIDNLVKLVLDALSPREMRKSGVGLAGAYANDSQVSACLARKRFVDQLDEPEPLTIIEIWAA